MAELEEKIKAAIKWFKSISWHHLFPPTIICFDELGNCEFYATFIFFTEKITSEI